MSEPINITARPTPETKAILGHLQIKHCTGLANDLYEKSCLLEQQRDAAVEKLEKAASTFEKYAILHLMKGTDDARPKSKANQDLADEFRATLAAIKETK